MPQFQKELEAALEAAALASKIILEAYATLEADPTAQANVTTKTDLASQEAILGHLMKKFPDDAFAAEEDTATLKQANKTGNRLWVIDPIDGTRGFARKNGEFSVMIGFCFGGKVVSGVVHEPALGRITFATKGQGCWKAVGKQNSMPCRVSTVTKMSEAVLARSHSKVPSEPGDMGNRLGVHRFLERYSAGVKLAAVARGEADLYINDYPSYRDWDLCAGVILVEEAGGLSTDAKGAALEFGRAGNLQDRGLVSCNSNLHQEVLHRLAAPVATA